MAENFPKVEKEMLNQVLEAQKYPLLSSQIKPKEEHAKTHSNQTDKNKDKDKILKAKRKKKDDRKGRYHKVNS